MVCRFSWQVAHKTSMTKFTVFFVLSCFAVLAFSLPHYWGYSSPLYYSLYSQGWGYRPYLSYPNLGSNYWWRYAPYGYHPLTYITVNGTGILTEEKSKND